MSAVRCSLVLGVAALSLTVAGCMMGGSPDGDTAKKGIFNLREPKMAKRDKGDARDGDDDIAGLSPEGSMHRDLLQLREREARQVETVENMRIALNQGEDDVRREEERLQEIRRQIERYDSAMRRYEMASRYASPRDDDRRNPEPALARGYDRDAGGEREYASSRQARDYGRAAPERNGYADRPAPDNRYRDNAPPASGREEVLYAGGYDDRFAPPVQARNQTPPQTQAPIQERAAPVRVSPRFDMDDLSHGDVFSVPVELASQPRQAAPSRQPETRDSDQALFAEAAARQKSQWPPAAAPTPAPAPAQARPAPRQQIQESVADSGGMDDEVFVPDLFLSRR